MDKYTVDLDQVLNDFEYSELTTEQPPPPPAPRVPQKNYSTTKHSINNVFSSLNDYLSAEINENIVEYNNTDNKYENLSFQAASTAAGNIVEYPSISNLYASPTSVLPQENVTEIASLGEHSRQNESIKELSLTPVKEKPLETLIAQPILLKLEINDDNQHSPEHLIIENDRIVKEKEVETLKELKELEKKFSVTYDEINVINSCVDQIPNQENDDSALLESPSLPLSSLQVELQLDEDIESVQKINFEADKKEFMQETLKDYVDVIDSVVHQAIEDVPQLDINELDEKNTQIDEKIDSKLEKVEEIDVNLNVTPRIKTTETHCDKIGFHIEVADEEAAKYLADLDDLEDDEDESFHDVPSNITHESEPLEINQVTHEVTNETNEITTETNKTKETIQSTPEITETNENKQVTKVEVEVTDFEVKHLVEGVKEIKITPVLNENTTRPNSLDIKDVKDETVNLIGNPGSTPYNNVYVSKENLLLPPPDVEESVSSASVSPTFSEASTDSVHSTDSPTLMKKQKSCGDSSQLDDADDVTQQDHGQRDSQSVDNEDNANVVEDEEETSVKEELNVPCHHSMSEEEDVYVDVDSINREADPVPESVDVDVPVVDADAETNSDLHENEHETNESSQTIDTSQEHEGAVWLGKCAPLWIPDADALCCQHCELKFTVIKRRHHCRACGLVLCSKCCGMKHKLEYLSAEARVCTRCYEVLSRETDSGSGDSQHSTPRRDGATSETSDASNSAANGATAPNPNNPMEYCSVVPPHQQVHAGSSAPSVMVPVGVLKRKGSNKKHNKSVMFCDGIRPGSDLTNLDQDFNYNDSRPHKPASSSTKKKLANQPVQKQAPKLNKNLPLVDPVTQSFIPENENCLPPTVTTYKSDITYTECGNNANVVEMLKNETLTFAVQRNLHIHVRLILMDCCVNKTAWCFSTDGLIAVGQDEIVILLEYIEGEAQVPKDVFHHLNNIYNSAVKGTTVTELGLSIHPTTNFLDSRNHAGFIFVRPTFQCLQNVILPKEPYLVGVLVHRWETPWARIFPLRLVLRLGAEYRYYPAPLISTRHRDSVFVEIGHTIINLLADFRNFSYTLPNIRGLTIHMEEKSTTVSIPVNRYDQVMKSMSNSSEHILAFGGNFSSEADSHLVCIQDTQGSDENNYKTHAINIQNKPRKVTGASFIVFNGALKSSSGLTAKSSIVEDGLMIQIPPEHMIKVRESLRNMKNHSIQCGCVNAASDETVNIVWCESDVNFNIGVRSSVDNQSLSGVPSIRVHNGKDYTCNSGTRLVRWTEVFLLQNGEENARTQDPVDISKVAESISKATCQALVKYLDLLATNSFMKIGIRTTLHVDDVSYSAGSNGQKLPPIYMKSLDNELVPVLHRITSAGNVGDGTIVLELIFRILNV